MWKNLKQAIALLIIYAMECDLSIEKIKNPVNKNHRCKQPNVNFLQKMLLYPFLTRVSRRLYY